MAASDAPHDRFHAEPVVYACPRCGRGYRVRREPPHGTACHRCRPPRPASPSLR